MEVFEVPQGMARSVFHNKYARKLPEGGHESWAEVAARVAHGNLSVVPGTTEEELQSLYEAIASGVAPTSGRHLQHGDSEQRQKLMESFTNCLDFDTRILTLEHGPAAIGSLAGTTVTVKAADGVWRPAAINAFGPQLLTDVTFGLTAGQGVKKVVRATTNHRWFLKDGTVTEALAVGDVLASAPTLEADCAEGLRHGVVYGDGSGHVVQGKQYVSLRLCTAGKQELLPLFDGFDVTYPPSAKGDPVVYLGRTPCWKDLPHTNDPEYIAGFIKGWWLADGAKQTGPNVLEISTSDTVAKDWLLDHAAYAGYHVTSQRVQERKAGDGSFKNGPVRHIIHLRRNAEWKVLSIEPAGMAPVYCAEEPVTSGFVLANGLLTGNCSTAMASFLKFWLLMKGSGVSRLYDSDLCRVNWDNLPNVRFVLEGPDQWDQGGHPDYEDWIENARDARHKYESNSEHTRWFEVEDSAEGWVKVVEILETAAWQEKHRDKLFVFDFSKVRCKGTPIRGQQNRPASGPVPLIKALMRVASIKGAGMRPWKQAMFVDHYLSSCVAVGGVRRAARLAGKTWRDRDIFEFIDIKRGGFLTTANNSVILDEEFWAQAADPRPSHGRRVFEAMVSAGYFDGTGEPGFINAHLMSWNPEGMEELSIHTLFSPEISARLSLHPRTMDLLGYTLEVAKKKRYPFVPNPCGEIILACWGAYCTIADVCLANATSVEQALHAGGEMAKFLVRVNRMDTLYRAEVNRTNRVGVGFTGAHEFAYRQFGCTWQDLVNQTEKGQQFWDFLNGLRDRIEHTARRYVDHLNVLYADQAEQSGLGRGSFRKIPYPHTITTVKPSGTISKVMFCTEGAHLPAYGHYVRWVQYGIDDPELKELQARGYPVKDVSASYPGHWVVGFPTELPIGRLMGQDFTAAGDATPEEQYRWLQLIEQYWLGRYGNQCSYTLKYNPRRVSFEEFSSMVLKYQSTVRCCSVMAQDDDFSAYAYVPEERIDANQYYAMMQRISGVLAEERYDEEALACEGGACPIEPNL